MMKPLTAKLSREANAAQPSVQKEYYDDGYGAAGCIFIARDTGRILLAHRNAEEDPNHGFVEEPDTWATWGGKIERGESAKDAVVREVEEETGYDGDYKLAFLWTYKDEDFEYHNYLAVVDFEFLPQKSWENDYGKWVEWGEWPRPMHFGLKALLQHAGEKIHRVVTLIKRKKASLLERKRVRRKLPQVITEMIQSQDPRQAVLFKKGLVGDGIWAYELRSPKSYLQYRYEPDTKTFYLDNIVTPNEEDKNKGYSKALLETFFQLIKGQDGALDSGPYTTSGTAYVKHVVERFAQMYGVRLVQGRDEMGEAIVVESTFRYFYHATLPNALPGIVTHGLRPSENPNWGGDLGAKSQGKVFVTDDFGIANFYGNVLWRKQPKRYRPILRFKYDQSRLIHDENTSGDYYSKTPIKARFEIFVYNLEDHKFGLGAGKYENDVEFYDTKGEWRPLTMNIAQAIATGEWDETEVDNSKGSGNMSEAGNPWEMSSDERRKIRVAPENRYRQGRPMAYSFDYVAVEPQVEGIVSTMHSLGIATTQSAGFGDAAGVSGAIPTTAVGFEPGKISPQTLDKIKTYLESVTTGVVVQDGAIKFDYKFPTGAKLSTIDAQRPENAKLAIDIWRGVEHILSQNLVSEAYDKTLGESLRDWNSKYWVHYSDVDYVKVNPNPSQGGHDPRGIYLFPLKLDLTRKNIGAYWGRKKYKIIVQLKPGLKILDLISLSIRDCARILVELGHKDKIKMLVNRKWVPSFAGMPKDETHPANVEYRKNMTLGHVLWILLRGVVFENNGVNFTDGLKKLGYDGIFGDENTICYDEIQLIIFDENNVNTIKTIPNTLGAKRRELRHKLPEAYGDPGDHVIFGGVFYPERVVANIVKSHNDYFGHTHEHGPTRWVYYQGMKTVFWHKFPPAVPEWEVIVKEWLERRGYKVERQTDRENYYKLMAWYQKKGLLKEIEDSGVILGALDKNGSNLQPVYSQDQLANHPTHMKTTDRRWRYYPELEQLDWQGQPTSEEHEGTKEFLAQRGLRVQRVHYLAGSVKRESTLLMEAITDEQAKAAVGFLKKMVAEGPFKGQVHLAGGPVRDMIMGKTPKDLDLSVVSDTIWGALKFTSWLAQQMGNYKGPSGPPPTFAKHIKVDDYGAPKFTPYENDEAFYRAIEAYDNYYAQYSNPVIFPKFGTAKLNLTGTFNGVDLTGVEVEAVSARKEIYEPGNRKPIQVLPGTLRDDALRRDFRANSLLMDLTTDNVFDVTGKGVEDIKNRILVTTSDPEVIFKEDPLRMMRAVRFMVQKGFNISPETEANIKKNASWLKFISRERVRDEIDKILVTKDPGAAFRKMNELGLLQYVAPEFRQMIGMTQNVHHTHDVFDHTMAVLAKTQPELVRRRIALFHDIGKLVTREATPTGVHFIGHEMEGPAVAERIMMDLKYPKTDIDAVKLGILHHMKLKHGGDDAVKLSDKSLRKFKIAVGQYLEHILDVIHADNVAHASASAMPNQVAAVRKRLETLDIKEVDKPTLPITGNDLIAIGIKPGPVIGKILSAVTDAWYENPSITKDQAMQIARQTYDKP